MEKSNDDIIDSILTDAAKSGASTGYKKGFKDAIDCLKELAEKAPDATVKKHASIFARGLEEFAQQTHDEFMKGLKLTVVVGPDGSHRVQ